MLVSLASGSLTSVDLKFQRQGIESPMTPVCWRSFTVLNIGLFLHLIWGSVFILKHPS